jgi:hypothetical protein
MNGTNCDLFTQNQSRSYKNHLVYTQHFVECTCDLNGDCVLKIELARCWGNK